MSGVTIHISGAKGAGKSTLARWIASMMGLSWKLNVSLRDDGRDVEPHSWLPPVSQELLDDRPIRIVAGEKEAMGPRQRLTLNDVIGPAPLPLKAPATSTVLELFDVVTLDPSDDDSIRTVQDQMDVWYLYTSVIDQHGDARLVGWMLDRLRALRNRAPETAEQHEAAPETHKAGGVSTPDPSDFAESDGHGTPAYAPNILQDALEAIDNRASQRDRPGGERSMATCVAAFNALTGAGLTEREGWVFMTVLKLSRAQGGRLQEDDYIDGAAYMALAGEAAIRGERDRTDGKGAADE